MDEGRRDAVVEDGETPAILLAAAHQVLRENGVRGLTVSEVLARANLSTRAFYRCFRSKDHLVRRVFADAAEAEAQRLHSRMAASADPVEAVAAWIDARLDLAMDKEVESALRYVSLEAQAHHLIDPEILAAALREMLEPLAKQLERGRERGLFNSVDAVADAAAIQGVVWSCVERQWAEGNGDPDEIRLNTLRFCLQAVGAPPERVKRFAGNRVVRSASGGLPAPLSAILA